VLAERRDARLAKPANGDTFKAVWSGATSEGKMSREARARRAACSKAG